MYNISYFLLFFFSSPLPPTVKRATAKGRWAVVGSKAEKMGGKKYADTFGEDKQCEIGDITHFDSLVVRNVLML